MEEISSNSLVVDGIKYYESGNKEEIDDDDGSRNNIRQQCENYKQTESQYLLDNIAIILIRNS